MSLANPSEMNVGHMATLACLLEATTPKPGNVHRGADFEDMTYYDVMSSAVAIAPVMCRAPSRSVGQTVLEAVQATRQVTSVNTNLGTILLLAPLASVPSDTRCVRGIAAVTANLTVVDTELVYEAIRLANPSGLGASDKHDVHEPATVDLATAMAMAADRDLVARQYADHFVTVFEEVAGRIAFLVTRGWSIIKSIIHVHLELMSRYPDSLIARKCGEARAQESSDRASIALASGPAGSTEYEESLRDFDFWLRSDGNRRNPGTTADLIAAGIFVALRDRLIRPPLSWK